MEYKNILLVDPDTVKGNSYVNDNVSDDMIVPAIREAQNIHLKELIGSCLLERIQELVYNSIHNLPDTIDDDINAAYKTLLDDYIVDYLTAEAQSLLTVPISFKIRNMGVTQDSDTNVQSAYMSTVKELKGWLETSADHYKNFIVKFLRQNKDAFPELKCGCDCGCDAGLGRRKFINVPFNYD